MPQQIQLPEIVLHIKSQHIFRRLVVVCREHHAEQPLDDERVAVHGHVHAAIVELEINPHLALAAAYLALVSFQCFWHLRQFPAEINDVLVAILPVVKEGECIDDVLAADTVPEWRVGRYSHRGHALSRTCRFQDGLPRTSSRDSRVGRIPARRPRVLHAALEQHGAPRRPPEPGPCRNPVRLASC